MFCRILDEAAQFGGRFVYEDNSVVAFEPLNPVTEGHLLVVPKAHVRDALGKPDVTAATMKVAATLATAPCNIITSAGTEATQTVFHLHLHIVPRRVADGLRLPWSEVAVAAMREQAEGEQVDNVNLPHPDCQRASTSAGPDYCAPCSELIGDWVPWAAHTAREQLWVQRAARGEAADERVRVLREALERIANEDGYQAQPLRNAARAALAATEGSTDG